MRERVLEIVILLIDILRNDKEMFINSEILSDSLKLKGYTDSEITTAYSWLMEKYDLQPVNHFSNFPKNQIVNRVLTASERSRVSTEAAGYLYKLLYFGLIDNENFEAVLDRIQVLNSRPFSLEEVKIIAASVVLRDLEEFDRHDIIESGDDPFSFIS